MESMDELDAELDIVRFPSNEEIQSALKNAGFYNGKIDGQIGSETRKAIKEFQRQNDLRVDGIIGRNTWETLGKFFIPAEEQELEETEELEEDDSLESEEEK
ncbi:MAG: peptidoglycan-binding protein [Candidatus Omnitrophica bacterium]|nr:peptidoglycan-binding protein [Candidatus Omnitrophota bacterium]